MNEAVRRSLEAFEVNSKLHFAPSDLVLEDEFHFFFSLLTANKAGSLPTNVLTLTLMTTQIYSRVHSHVRNKSGIFRHLQIDIVIIISHSNEVKLKGFSTDFEPEKLLSHAVREKLMNVMLDELICVRDDEQHRNGSNEEKQI